MVWKRVMDHSAEVDKVLDQAETGEYFVAETGRPETTVHLVCLDSGKFAVKVSDTRDWHVFPTYMAIMLAVAAFAMEEMVDAD